MLMNDPAELAVFYGWQLSQRTSISLSDGINVVVVVVRLEMSQPRPSAEARLSLTSRGVDSWHFATSHLYSQISFNQYY